MRLDLSPHARATHWTAQYIGLPWTERFTCWDLVRSVQKHEFGRVLPAFTPGAADASRAPELVRLADAQGWRPVAGAARDGDVILMRGADGPHVGVVVERAGRASEVLHNIGGTLNGRTWGSVRLDPLAGLGRLGYGHLSLWRAAS
jgi:cell wall-associated NlpC family hydrolase